MVAEKESFSSSRHQFSVLLKINIIPQSYDDNNAKRIIFQILK